MATVTFSTTEPIVSATFEVCGLACLMCVGGVEAEAAVPRLGDPATCDREGLSRQLTVPYTVGTAVQVSFGCRHYADAASLTATLVTSCTMPPTVAPTVAPSTTPTLSPTPVPTRPPSTSPTPSPTPPPTSPPTRTPTAPPTESPSPAPTAAPSTSQPTSEGDTWSPTAAPTLTLSPTAAPIRPLTKDISVTTPKPEQQQSAPSGEDDAGGIGTQTIVIAVTGIVLVIGAAVTWRRRHNRAPDSERHLPPPARSNPTFAPGAAADDYEDPVPVAMQGRPRKQGETGAGTQEHRGREQRRRREQPAISNPAFPNRIYAAINENVAGVAGGVQCAAVPSGSGDVHHVPMAGGHTFAVPMARSAETVTDSCSSGHYEAPVAVTMQDRAHAATRDQPPIPSTAGHPGTAQDAGDYEAPVPVAVQDQRFAETRDQPPIPSRGPVYHVLQMHSQVPRGTGEYVSLNGNQQPYNGAGNQPDAGNYVSLDGNQRAYGSNSTA